MPTLPSSSLAACSLDPLFGVLGGARVPWEPNQGLRRRILQGLTTGRGTVELSGRRSGPGDSGASGKPQGEKRIEGEKLECGQVPLLPAGKMQCGQVLVLAMGGMSAVRHSDDGRRSG